MLIVVLFIFTIFSNFLQVIKTQRIIVMFYEDDQCQNEYETSADLDLIPMQEEYKHVGIVIWKYEKCFGFIDDFYKFRYTNEKVQRVGYNLLDDEQTTLETYCKEGNHRFTQEYITDGECREELNQDLIPHYKAIDSSKVNEAEFLSILPDMFHLEVFSTLEQCNQKQKVFAHVIQNTCENMKVNRCKDDSFVNTLYSETECTNEISSSVYQKGKCYRKDEDEEHWWSLLENIGYVGYASIECNVTSVGIVEHVPVVKDRTWILYGFLYALPIVFIICCIIGCIIYVVINVRGKKAPPKDEDADKLLKSEV